MEPDTEQKSMSKPSFFDRYAAIIKMATIGVLILLLLIPSYMVMDIIKERERNQDSVQREISNKWGLAQTISGPFVTIPYVVSYKRNNVVNTETKYIQLLPENLDIKGDLDTSQLKRGIYEVITYATKLNIKGKFLGSEISKLNIPSEDIQWGKATLNLGITDLTGVRDAISVKWGSDTFHFNPGVATKEVVHSGVSSSIRFNNTAETDFSFVLDIQGSNNIHFLPVGKETNVYITSKCPNPKFEGSFLPIDRNVENNGFFGDWKVLHLNRNFPQVWAGGSQNISQSWFGVSLMTDVDHYQKTMRSAKYAILFIAMTFLTFFFIEILNKRKIHPIQYILIGLVLVLFYVLLLSLSEQVGFNVAYLIASLATILLITIYTVSALKSRINTVVMFTVLSVLYAFIFIIIQLAEYSLLFGSIGLFLFLATVMLASRKVNWYNIGAREE